MSISEELRHLADLHREGMLSDDEFATAKHQLLADSQQVPVEDRRAADPPATDDQAASIEISNQQPDMQPAPGTPVRNEPDAAQPDILLDEAGYVVTSRQIVAPSGKVYPVNQVVSCIVQRGRTETKETINHGRTRKAEMFRRLAWTSVAIFLVLAFIFPDYDGAFFPVLAVLTMLVLFGASMPTRTVETSTQPEYTVRIRTTNMTQSEVLITADEEAANRLYNAVMAATG